MSDPCFGAHFRRWLGEPWCFGSLLTSFGAWFDGFDRRLGGNNSPIGPYRDHLAVGQHHRLQGWFDPLELVAQLADTPVYMDGLITATYHRGFEGFAHWGLPVPWTHLRAFLPSPRRRG